MLIFGTRPEAIKMAPIIKAIYKDNRFESVVVITGQHREMLDQVLSDFKIVPDYDLNLMKTSQTLSSITTGVISNLDNILKNDEPDIVLVHGDTATTFAASISAFYHQIPIGHVEAGLRTWNKYSPFPEEMNRQLTDTLADIYFAPTTQSKDNLLLENHAEENIYVTGNTAIDALRYTVQRDYNHAVLSNIDKNHRLILLTMHRRENQDGGLKDVFQSVKHVVQEYDDVEVVFPVHLSPVVQNIAHEVFDNVDKVHLLPPLNTIDFQNLAAKSYFIMTDSGGVQEEAPSLGKPVLVLRDTTERPEGVVAGTLKLVGTHADNVTEGMKLLLDDVDTYQKMAQAKNPYGDGNASEKILDAIHHYFE
ncbi:non-hydrolyzing UDP-N-acetylglucosamine 2-epimerase [Leuconostoc carnosum]|uniref:non-hydrolyzing UDP-N-acetylglucosamine 2-epimerase n=1 Tax=Leuconostoc carnosum TaxID=1252 RepID=UPI00345EE480